MTRAMVRICGAAAAIALLLGASTAKASLIFGGRCLSSGQPFAQFGDYRSYSFVPDGGLELGGLGWLMSGGTHVVAGNETFYVHAAGDSRSLSLPTGGSATTPLICMGTSSTYLRFFMKNGGSGSLRVQVVERNLLGAVIGVLDWTTLAGSPAWQPSPKILNLNSLQGLLGVSVVQLRLTATSGSWQVDDVYVDPWSSGN